MPDFMPTAVELDHATRRFFATNSTRAALSLTAGATTIDALEAAFEVGMVDQGRLQARSNVQIAFFGTGEDGAAGDYRVWVGRFLYGHDRQKTREVLILPLGNGAVTLGTCLGAGTDGVVGVATTERYADTITWSNSAYGTLIASSILVDGTNDEYSPADNTPGVLSLSSFGRADFWFVEFAKGTATDLNCHAGVSLV